MTELEEFYERMWSSSNLAVQRLTKEVQQLQSDIKTYQTVGVDQSSIINDLVNDNELLRERIKELEADKANTINYQAICMSKDHIIKDITRDNELLETRVQMLESEHSALKEHNEKMEHVVFDQIYEEDKIHGAELNKQTNPVMEYIITIKECIKDGDIKAVKEELRILHSALDDLEEAIDTLDYYLKD